MTLTPDQLQLEQILRASPPRTLRKTVFNLANAYSQAGSVVMAASQGNADFAGPLVMCHSFAIELLLKFFIINDQPRGKTFKQLKAGGMKFQSPNKSGKPGGHGYSDLFEMVSPAVQEKIAKRYCVVSGTETDIAGFSEALVSQGEEPFVKWRYIYEQEAGQFTHLDVAKFSNVLHALGEAAAAELEADPNS